MQGSQLGPGTYQYKSCIDELKDKKTSEKGPYELYSGDRNKPISEGYLAAPVRSNIFCFVFTVQPAFDVKSKMCACFLF